MSHMTICVSACMFENSKHTSAPQHERSNTQSTRYQQFTTMCDSGSISGFESPVRRPMDPNLGNSQSNPVSQNEPMLPELELWEPPFERWLRIADAALRGIPTPHKEVARTPRA